MLTSQILSSQPVTQLNLLFKLTSELTFEGKMDEGSDVDPICAMENIEAGRIRFSELRCAACVAVCVAVCVAACVAVCRNNVHSRFNAEVRHIFAVCIPNSCSALQCAAATCILFVELRYAS